MLYEPLQTYCDQNIHIFVVIIMTPRHLYQHEDMGVIDTETKTTDVHHQPCVSCNAELHNHVDNQEYKNISSNSKDNYTIGYNNIKEEEQQLGNDIK